MGIGFQHPCSVGGTHTDTVGQIIALLLIQILKDIQQVTAAAQQYIQMCIRDRYVSMPTPCSIDYRWMNRERTLQSMM